MASTVFPLKTIAECFGWSTPENLPENRLRAAVMAAAGGAGGSPLWCEGVDQTSAYTMILCMVMTKKLLSELDIASDERVFDDTQVRAAVLKHCNTLNPTSGYESVTAAITQAALDVAETIDDRWKLLRHIRPGADITDLSMIYAEMQGLESESPYIVSPQELIHYRTEQAHFGVAIQPLLQARRQKICHPDRVMYDRSHGVLPETIPSVDEDEERISREIALTSSIIKSGVIETTSADITAWSNMNTQYPITAMLVVYYIDLMIGVRVSSLNHIMNAMKRVIRAYSEAEIKWRDLFLPMPDIPINQLERMRVIIGELVKLEQASYRTTIRCLVNVFPVENDLMRSEMIVKHCEAWTTEHVISVLLLWYIQAYRDGKLFRIPNVKLSRKGAISYMRAYRPWSVRFFPPRYRTEAFVSETSKSYLTVFIEGCLSCLKIDTIWPGTPSPEYLKHLHRRYERKAMMRSAFWIISSYGEVRESLYRLSARDSVKNAITEIARDALRNRATIETLICLYFIPFENKNRVAKHILEKESDASGAEEIGESLITNMYLSEWNLKDESGELLALLSKTTSTTSLMRQFLNDVTCGILNRPMLSDIIESNLSHKPSTIDPSIDTISYTGGINHVPLYQVMKKMATHQNERTPNGIAEYRLAPYERFDVYGTIDTHLWKLAKFTQSSTGALVRSYTTATSVIDFTLLKNGDINLESIVEIVGERFQFISRCNDDDDVDTIIDGHLIRMDYDGELPLCSVQCLPLVELSKDFPLHQSAPAVLPPTITVSPAHVHIQFKFSEKFVVRSELIIEFPEGTMLRCCVSDAIVSDT
jgi:hypothetical protein